MLLVVSAVTAQAADRAPVASLLELRRANVIVQKWDLSCGAAALATLLTYHHGDPVTERDVATQLIRRDEYVANPQLVTLRQGFSLLDLKRYVDARGYRGTGYGRMTLDDLVELAPVLVPINTQGYNHFVLFRGFARDRALLADPAWGNRTMPRARFENVWIDYPKFGRVGFTVRRTDGRAAANGLAPRAEEFLMLR